ncbi:MAG: SURF1 family cytochrome oxidase biogenesis protein, partial [Comamonas sp.]
MAVSPLRSLRRRLAMLGTLCLTLALLLALGGWQVQRLGWKRDLMAQVASRLSAAPVAVAPPAAWPGLDVQAEAYRKVRLSGQLLTSQRLLVYAATDLGPGYWVMTPLRLDAEPAAVVWINQGYIPNTEKARFAAATASPGTGGAEPVSVAVSGLLRPAEAPR